MIVRLDPQGLAEITKQKGILSRIAQQDSDTMEIYVAFTSKSKKLSKNLSSLTRLARRGQKLQALSNCLIVYAGIDRITKQTASKVMQNVRSARC
jgi:hypothetical protein